MREGIYRVNLTEMKKIWYVVLAVVLAFIFFIIFAKKSEYDKERRWYRERIEWYRHVADSLDNHIGELETEISVQRDSISALEENRRLLEKRLADIKKEHEETRIDIISSDTDWNLRFLSDYLSEETRF